jgi:hypothetical protein
MEALSNVQRAFELYRQSYEAANKAASILSGGPADFYFNKLETYVNALFTKFAPFKAGDRVELTVAPKTEGTGWYHCRHFLIPGAVGTVVSVVYYKWRNIYSGWEGFVAGVVFDRETWIDKDGVERPVQEKHSFQFRENELCKLETP